MRMILYLQSRDYVNFSESVISNVNLLSLATITFVMINIFLKFSVGWFFRTDMQVEERIFYSKLYIWGSYALGGAYIFTLLGVSLSNLTLFFGLIATGFAFAVRDILMAFIGWIILLRKKPFRIGDYIRIGDDEGKVQHIGTFYVVLDTTPDFPQDFTRVPNKVFLDKSIYNYGNKDIHESIKFNLKDIPKDMDKKAAKIKQIIEKIVPRREHIAVYLDVLKDNVYLVVEYRTDFTKKEQTKSAVIKQVFFLIKRYILIKN